MFEDTKGVIRIRKSRKNRQHNGQMKKDKMTTKIYKTLRRKLKNEQHESAKNRGWTKVFRNG